jgi:hypothetical protein
MNIRESRERKIVWCGLVALSVLFSAWGWMTRGSSAEFTNWNEFVASIKPDKNGHRWVNRGPTTIGFITTNKDDARPTASETIFLSTNKATGITTNTTDVGTWQIFSIDLLSNTNRVNFGLNWIKEVCWELEGVTITRPVWLVETNWVTVAHVQPEKITRLDDPMANRATAELMTANAIQVIQRGDVSSNLVAWVYGHGVTNTVRFKSIPIPEWSNEERRLLEYHQSPFITPGLIGW